MTNNEPPFQKLTVHKNVFGGWSFRIDNMTPITNIKEVSIKLSDNKPLAQFRVYSKTRDTGYVYGPHHAAIYSIEFFITYYVLNKNMSVEISLAEIIQHTDVFIQTPNFDYDDRIYEQ